MPTRDTVMILTEEFDPHADIMIALLQERAPGIEVFRFHSDMFPEAAGLEVFIGDNGYSAHLQLYHRRIDLSRIRSVWVRRPHKPKLAPQIPAEFREWSQAETDAALRGALFSMGARMVNPYAADLVASHKLYQLRAAMNLGFPISPTLVSNMPERALDFFLKQEGDVIFKPLTYPTIRKGDPDELRVLYTQKVLPKQLEGQNGERIRHVPVQLQRVVKKMFEVRVTVVGDQVFSAALKTDVEHLDIRRWSKTKPKYSVFDLPADVKQRCVNLVRSLDLYFGAIDLLVTCTGEFLLLEVNPNGQFYWIQRETGLPIMEAVADLLVHVDTVEEVTPWS